VAEQELGEQERDIASLVAEGLTDAEIADRLVLAGEAVSDAIERAQRTLAVRSRLKLAIWASRQGRSAPQRHLLITEWP
jgi:DNA-binding NarL/FixJ family response regulator